MQSQHLLFSLLFLRGGRDGGGTMGKEVKRRLERPGNFLSYWVAADWSPCHHLDVCVVSESLVTLLSALFCQETGLTGLSADLHLGFFWLGFDNVAL